MHKIFNIYITVIDLDKDKRVYNCLVRLEKTTMNMYGERFPTYSLAHK